MCWRRTINDEEENNKRRNETLKNKYIRERFEKKIMARKKKIAKIYFQSFTFLEERREKKLFNHDRNLIKRK